MNPSMIRRGTMITCPECKHEIAVLLVDIRLHMMIKIDYFRWLNEQYVNGMQMCCLKCRVPWFVSGKLHTEYGWLP